MPSLSCVKSGGKKYYRIVASKRVNGKPRPIPICYLGTVDQILEIFQNYDEMIKISDLESQPPSETKQDSQEPETDTLKRLDKKIEWITESRNNWKEKCKQAKADLKTTKLSLSRLKEKRDSLKKIVQDKSSLIESLEGYLQKANDKINHLESQIECKDQEISRLKKKVISVTEDARAQGYTYSLSFIEMSINMLHNATHRFRNVSNVMKLFMQSEKIERAPSHETCIQWELKIGYYKLTQPIIKEDGMIWIADHMVNTGSSKCLAVLGVRLDKIVGKEDLTLSFDDVTPLAIIPMKKSNGTTIDEELEKLAKRAGIPSAILIDHGSDLKCGTEKFCQRHPRVIQLYDVVHKIAIDLSKKIEDNPRWNTFKTLSSESKKKMHLTNHHLQSPPNQRSKARWLNFDILIDWANKRFELWDNQVEEIPEQLTWLLEYRSDVERWNHYVHVARTTREVVRKKGYGKQTSLILEDALLELNTTDSGVESFTCDLIDFVSKESTHANRAETLVGSSEIIESAFGWFKYLLGASHWSKSGIGRMILSLSSRLGGLNQQIIEDALNTVSMENVNEWLQEAFDT